jgi:hypothetical protein
MFIMMYRILISSNLFTLCSGSESDPVFNPLTSHLRSAPIRDPAIINPLHLQQVSQPSSLTYDYAEVTANIESVRTFLEHAKVEDFSSTESYSLLFGSLFYADAANKSDFNQMGRILRAFGGFSSLHPEDVTVGSSAFLSEKGRDNVKYYKENFYDVEYGGGNKLIRPGKEQRGRIPGISGISLPVLFQDNMESEEDRTFPIFIVGFFLLLGIFVIVNTVS